MAIGAAEDAVKQPTLVEARAKLILASLAGLDAIRPTALWKPGQTEPTPDGLEALENAVDAADLGAVRVFLSIYPFGSSVTPLTDEAQAQFAKYAAALAAALPTVQDFIIGNEPNLNRFWLPQYDADGNDAAAPAFMSLLARTYDAVKIVSPDSRIWGLGLSPHGSDNPNAARKTHSPTIFLRDLAAAYRKSGRDEPIMDGLAIHPYPEASNTPPSVAHPNSTTIGVADYPKLVKLLTVGFIGTAQKGATLPIIYSEYGTQTQIPSSKAEFYSDAEQSTTKPVSPEMQGKLYRQAIALSFCQPNVEGFLIFHLLDEESLTGWQSGLYYADETAKPSRDTVREAVSRVRRGVIARCDELKLVPHLTGFSLAGGKKRFARLPTALSLRCDIDCRFVLRLQREPLNTTTFQVRGTTTGGNWARVALGRRRVAPGPYRFLLTIWASVNTGRVRTLVPVHISIAAQP